MAGATHDQGHRGDHGPSNGHGGQGSRRDVRLSAQVRQRATGPTTTRGRGPPHIPQDAMVGVIRTRRTRSASVTRAPSAGAPGPGSPGGPQGGTGQAGPPPSNRRSRGGGGRRVRPIRTRRTKGSASPPVPHFEAEVAVCGRLRVDRDGFAPPAPQVLRTEAHPVQAVADAARE